MPEAKMKLHLHNTEKRDLTANLQGQVLSTQDKITAPKKKNKLTIK